MNQKLLTGIAISCGLICAACVALFMWSVQGQADAARAEVLARYGGEQVEVCVALRDIAAGERLDASSIETKLWVADLLPEGAISEVGSVVGRTATASILKGEVISERRFEATQSAFDIPAGKEAVSVPAKAVQAVGGAIGTGMNVDVYSSGNSETSLIAEGVLVLDVSVGDSGSFVSGDSGWLTLAVSPESVEQLISASNKTSLYFVLPGGADDAAADRAIEETASEGAADADADGDGQDGSAATPPSPEPEEGDGRPAPDEPEDESQGGE